MTSWRDNAHMVRPEPGDIVRSKLTRHILWSEPDGIDDGRKSSQIDLLEGQWAVIISTKRVERFSECVALLLCPNGVGYTLINYLERKSRSSRFG